MTNTDTADVPATVRQVAALARAGSELVRVTVNNEEAAAAVPEIWEGLDRIGVDVPIVGDFHYNGHLLLTKYPECARVLAKYRINPGNVGGKRADEHFRTIIEVALQNEKPVRIGVNWGSLDLVDVYRMLAPRSDYPLHLGLTEAGMGMKGMVASTAGLSVLLQEGIGDTIRVSLTPEPNGDRTVEVQVAQQVLQSLGLRSFSPQVTSCPGCGRTTSTFFQQMALDIQDYLREKMPVWREARPGVEELRVAVMGCVVNGPGESKHAHLGISLPGTFEDPKAPVYVDGRLLTTLKGDNIVPEFLQILEEYVESRYGLSGYRAAPRRGAD